MFGLACIWCTRPQKWRKLMRGKQSDSDDASGDSGWCVFLTGLVPAYPGLIWKSTVKRFCYCLFLMLWEAAVVSSSFFLYEVARAPFMYQCWGLPHGLAQCCCGVLYTGLQAVWIKVSWWCRVHDLRGTLFCHWWRRPRSDSGSETLSGRCLTASHLRQTRASTRPVRYVVVCVVLDCQKWQASYWCCVFLCIRLG